MKTDFLELFLYWLFVLFASSAFIVFIYILTQCALYGCSVDGVNIIFGE